MHMSQAQALRVFQHPERITQAERDGLLLYKTFEGGKESTWELLSEDLYRGQVFNRSDRDTAMYAAITLLARETFTRCTEVPAVLANDLVTKWESAFAAVRFCARSFDEARTYSPLVKALEPLLNSEKRYEILRALFSAIAVREEPKLSLDRHLALVVLNELEGGGGPKLVNAAGLNLRLWSSAHPEERIFMPLKRPIKKLYACFAKGVEKVLSFISGELCREELKLSAEDREIVLGKALIQLARATMSDNAAGRLSLTPVRVRQWQNAIQAVAELRRYPEIVAGPARAFLGMTQAVYETPQMWHLERVWKIMPDPKCREFALGILKQVQKRLKKAA